MKDEDRSKRSGSIEGLRFHCLFGMLIIFVTIMTAVRVADGLAAQEGSVDRWAINISRLAGPIVIETDDELRRLNNFSFDMRIRFLELRDGRLFKLNRKANEDGFHVTLDGNRLRMGFGANGKVTTVVMPEAMFAPGNWYRVSGVKDGDQAQLFVNGREVARGGVVAEIFDSIGTFEIGGNGFVAPVEVSRFRFWGDVLDGSQIKTLNRYGQAFKGPKPMIDYRFLEGGGRLVGNAVSQMYQGLIQGGDPALGWAALDKTPARLIKSDENATTAFVGKSRHSLDLSGSEKTLIVDDIHFRSSTMDFTVQLDVKLNNMRSGTIARAESTRGTVFSLGHNSGRVWLDLGKGTSLDRINSPAESLRPGQWVRLTALQEKGLASVFVNKVRVASFPARNGIDGSHVRLSFGEGETSAAFELAMARVWCRALSPNQLIASKDEAARSLMLQFGPWETAAHDAIIPDESGSGHDGALKGPRALLWHPMDQTATQQLALAINEGQLRKSGESRDRGGKMQSAEPSNITRKDPTDQPEGRINSIDIRTGHSAIVTLPRPADTIVVDDPNVARAEILSPRKVYLIGDDVGQTGFFALDRAGQIIDEKRIEVLPDIDVANDALAHIEGGGDNRFELVGGRLALRGPAEDIDEARDLAAVADTMSSNGMSVRNETTIKAAQQVNIRVRFAEVSRKDLTRLGIQWGAVVNAGGVGGEGQFFLRDPFSLTAGSILGQLSAGDVDIEFLFEALEQEGALSMLAEPNLTVLNGEEAKFLAGGELPIPVPRSDGNANTIEFKPFGVSLTFRPVLLGNNRISLRVASEVSDLAFDTAIELSDLIIPVINVRRAETSLELASGESFAVGGLFKRTVTQSIVKVPGLASLPILGSLFRSERFGRSETELVILITPYLVQPVDDPQQLAFPGGGNADRVIDHGSNGELGFIIR